MIRTYLAAKGGAMPSFVHVVPLGDLREHMTATDCWCAPTPDDDEPSVWIHNSLDRREHTIEQGKVQ